MRALWILILGAALLSGCARDRWRGDVGYQQAVTLPETPVEGLKSGTTAGAMSVPAQPAEVVPYARQVQAVNQAQPHMECLDMPPPKS